MVFLEIVLDLFYNFNFPDQCPERTEVMNLSPQEESFCVAYAEGMSGAEAARLAHYSSGNARHQASRMLTKPHISELVAELSAEIIERRLRWQEELSARLDFIYEKARAEGDDDGVLQVVELQG